MTKVQELARFVVQASYDALSSEAKQEIKIRVIDSIGCAIGALRAEPIRMLRAQIEDFGGNRLCTLIGGGKTAPDRAALYNGALVRYLDFMDSYLAKGETCHPSDNIGAILAASEYASTSGKAFLTAVAVSYQVQCRLSDVAPVRHKGFDHTTQGSYSVAAGVSKALGLDKEKTANAIAISGTAFNALRVTRTGKLSHWKGLAFPNTAFGATHAAFLAMRGVTGPSEVFEGNKGFMETIAGRFELDWSKEDLEGVTRTIVKKYNAEIHAQSAIEGILELKKEEGFSAGDIELITIDIFDVAYNIIGGGEEGEKVSIRTKEEADHSLPYMIAVAVLDGAVTPRQYLLNRINKDDVQSLLRKVIVQPDAEYSRIFPEGLPCRIHARLMGGRTVAKEKRDYEGFFTRSLSWEKVTEKFMSLCPSGMDKKLKSDIIDAVARLEEIKVADLMRLLAKVPCGKTRRSP
jgi:2-methylcitrate dehydratase